MIKISTIFGLGILVFFTQFFGLPMDWKNCIYLVSGLLIAVLATLIRRELLDVLKRLHTEPESTETFSESRPPADTKPAA
ncbi:MAG: hypothetical protein KGH93_03470 [Patescibacteria group bacterium]|nr:hypothetical protein [Patescibacteria group bacterium]MDE1946223.1 hypothetical protein [Patescibacteria group bacterium]